MSLFKFLLVFILSPALLLSQLTNNTVTATASQTTSTTPDQANLSITVSSGASATLEQIVNALSGVGVTAANLNSVYIGPQWNFQLTVSLAQLATTSAALTAVEKSISQNNSGLSLSFYISGTQFSGQVSSNCNFAALLAQARTQVQQIAGAAGLQTGAITALSAAATACSLTATFAITALFGQPGPNTITISASGTSSASNDQATIYLNVTSPLTADLSDVTNALTANGITGAALSGLDTTTLVDLSGNYRTVLNWSLTLTVPLSRLTATLAEITAAGQGIGEQNPGWALTFNSVLTSASQTQQAAACSQSTLVSGALALAQQIATAAGVSVGAVLNISQGGSGVAGAYYGLATEASFLLGFVPVSGPSPCGLTLQYQLL